MSKLSSNMPIFLPHHLGGMTLNQPRFHVFLTIIIIIFGIKMPWHALHACAHALTPICLKIPSNLLHMELTRTQLHKKYDITNRYG